MSESFVVRATRRALEEAGAELFFQLEIPEVGPTTNQMRSGSWKDSHAHRNRMHEAVDKALGKKLLDGLKPDE